jgi:hypothetical protein
VLVAVLAAVGAALVLVDGHRAEPSPGRAPGPPADVAGAVTAFLPDLADGLADGDERALAEAAAGDAARRELAALATNLRRLRVTALSLRYVDESDVQLTRSDQQRLGDRAWVADVELSWRFGGLDRRRSALEVPVVLTWDGSDPEFVTSRVTGGRRVPLWWQAAVVVRRTPDTLVLTTRRRGLAGLSRQAVTAVDTVRATLPGWRGPLVVEAAGNGEEFLSASGLSAASAREIAAVTTTTDGSGSSRSASHIYLNPPVFDPLGPQARQIVVSHEATHVALGAATTSAPTWLSEGIADYVALVDTDVPVRVLAAQVLRLVRAEGAPRHLPGQAELDSGDADIGAWYEAAWLAALLVADRHGEEALLELYRVADADGATDRAFREVLGTTEEAFVEEWRAELGRLAG